MRISDQVSGEIAAWKVEVVGHAHEERRLDWETAAAVDEGERAESVCEPEEHSM